MKCDELLPESVILLTTFWSNLLILWSEERGLFTFLLIDFVSVFANSLDPVPSRMKLGDSGGLLPLPRSMTLLSKEAEKPGVSSELFEERRWL